MLYTYRELWTDIDSIFMVKSILIFICLKFFGLCKVERKKKTMHLEFSRSFAKGFLHSDEFNIEVIL